MKMEKDQDQDRELDGAVKQEVITSKQAQYMPGLDPRGGHHYDQKQRRPR